MKSQTVHVGVWTFFCICLAAGLFGRWESVRHVREPGADGRIHLSHDEIVLLKLGKNLARDSAHYHLQEWYQREREAGREPPDYLAKPLFKHPPVMATMLAWVDAPGIQGARNAFGLTMLLGLTVCAAVYGLARFLLTPMWSLVPAAIAWVDPVLWSGSVKIWLDLPLTFFCAAGLGFAWRGRTHPASFLTMGVCFGLAMLTKYPAVAVWAAATALLGVDRSFRKGPYFAAGCLLPWLMFAPWAVWNLSVLGNSTGELEEFRHIERLVIAHAAGVVALAIAAGLLLWVRRGMSGLRPSGTEKSATDGRRLLFALFVLTVAGLFLFHSWFSGRIEPRFGVAMNFFQEGRAWFYLDRLLCLDPLLWPGIIALFWIRLPPPADFIRWTAIAYLLAFSVWGNYQSRYIMPVVPLVCVLSAWSLYQISNYLRKPGSLWLERAWVGAWIAFAAVRLAWIHEKLTLPNQFTYF